MQWTPYDQGRNSQPIYRTVTVGTASGPLAPGSGARWELVICPPSSGVIWFGPGPLAVAGVGYSLTPGALPMRIQLGVDGSQVIDQWSVIADAGAPLVRVIEHRLLPCSEQDIHPGAEYKP